MGLIYNNQIIIPEKVHQSMGHSACRHPRKVPGIIFYSRAETGLPKHLNVKIRPLGNPLSLQQLVLALKITYPFFQLRFYIYTCPVNLLLGHHIMGGGKYCNVFKGCMHLSRQRLHLCYSVYFITKKFHTYQIIPALPGINLQHITPDAETSASQIHVVSVILDINQLVNHLVPVLGHSRA